MELTSEAQKYGYIRDGKVYLRGYRNFPDREIGVLKESEESTFKYFEDRFATAEAKVSDLERVISESVNKGSYLMKLIHLKKSLTEMDALGDFDSLLQRLELLEVELNAIVAKNREKNLEIKRALIAEAESLDQIADWKEATERLKEIKANWVKTGGVNPEYKAEIEERFENAIQRFFERKQAFYDERKKMIEERVARYESIIKEVAKLKNEEAGKAIALTKKLQEDWKKVGKVPQALRNELWTKFKEHTNEIFKEHKREKRREKGAANPFEEKQKLIDAVENLSRQDLPDKEVKQKVKQWQNRWKTAGHIQRRDKAFEMNNKFFFYCDLALEKSFINRIAKNNLKENDSEKNEVNLKIKVLNDLLARDEKELALFQENMQKMSIEERSFSKMMQGKLNLQQRKVDVKRYILKELKEKLKNI